MLTALFTPHWCEKCLGGKEFEAWIGFETLGSRLWMEKRIITSPPFCKASKMIDHSK